MYDTRTILHIKHQSVPVSVSVCVSMYVSMCVSVYVSVCVSV